MQRETPTRIAEVAACPVAMTCPSTLGAALDQAHVEEERLAVARIEFGAVLVPFAAATAPGGRGLAVRRVGLLVTCIVRGTVPVCVAVCHGAVALVVASVSAICEDLVHAGGVRTRVARFAETGCDLLAIIALSGARIVFFADTDTGFGLFVIAACFAAITALREHRPLIAQANLIDFVVGLAGATSVVRVKHRSHR